MFMDSYASGIGTNSRVATPQPISFYERGSACASANDFVEAHKWFNLAAREGEELGAAARADVALDMNAREIAEAQRRARIFLLN
jgi:hypothetical protein